MNLIIPKNYNPVLDLRDTEIAAIMHKSPNNVNVLLHRAKKALKTQLKKEGFMDEDLS